MNNETNCHRPILKVSPTLSSNRFGMTLMAQSRYALNPNEIHMRRTTVTRITRIILLLWLIVTAVLLWQTVRRPARSAPAYEIGGWHEDHEVNIFGLWKR